MSRFFDCAVAGRAHARHRAGGAGRARAASSSCCPPTPSTASAATPSPPPGVRALLSAKGRGRDMPVPVLVGSPRTLDGLAATLTQQVRDLVEAFWPGPLTVVCRQAPSLVWDLGDTRRHGRGADAAAPGGDRAAARRRPDGGVLGQHLGPAAGHDPRRGRRAARRRRRRLPRRRAVRLGAPVVDRGRHRAGPDPRCARASSTPTRSARWPRRSWCPVTIAAVPRPARLHRQHLPLADGRAPHALRARPRLPGDVRPGGPRRGRHLPRPHRPGDQPAGRARARRAGRRRLGVPRQGLGRPAVEHADLVLCATRDHVRDVVGLVPAAAGRTFTLRQLAAVAAVQDAAGRGRRRRPGRTPRAAARPGAAPPGAARPRGRHRRPLRPASRRLPGDGAADPERGALGRRVLHPLRARISAAAERRGEPDERRPVLGPRLRCPPGAGPRDRRGHPRRARPAARRPPADRQRELHVPGGAGRAGLDAVQQVRRGLPRQALLRRLRRRRPGRDDRHRARQGAVRRRARQPAAALGRQRQPRGLRRVPVPGRHRARDGPASRAATSPTARR